MKIVVLWVESGLKRAKLCGKDELTPSKRVIEGSRCNCCGVFGSMAKLKQPLLIQIRKDAYNLIATF